MKAGRLTITISVALACAYLAGCASAETPAPAPAVTQAGASGPDKAFLEDNPEKLKAFSCEALDDAMASNYNLAAIWEKQANPMDRAIADFSAKKFKVQQKEYKSRCKGEPAKLAAAKRWHPHCKLLPNA